MSGPVYQTHHSLLLCPLYPGAGGRGRGNNSPSWNGMIALTELPFTTICVRALLRDDDDSNPINCSRTRPGDIQFQPLSTVFSGDCTECGHFVLDTSDLDNVQYSIVAFPMHYMAEVYYHDEAMGWDPVEDEQPGKEPDVVHVSPRPRLPLYIAQWLGKYFNWQDHDAGPVLLRLEDRPFVDVPALDYIWPPELENQGRASPKSVIYTAVTGL
ncbi:uncharacterized protein BJX67DRAFT_325582 [Aspergillus lucknowensis]|uniref:Uncharacterized protein n=1 Tax=Aspergillus lucknowensis TaxID=176173 RepID=A0ABR4L8Q0_9EURO